ncbi:MAG: hypothetical protein EBX52_12450, partial [Proteobacteria bacterium]|nr:hypothetical protein [Pseudomonadota bacterium]
MDRWRGGGTRVGLRCESRSRRRCRSGGDSIGETDAEHGVLVWNLLDLSSHFILLDNPFAYCEAVLFPSRRIEYRGRRYDGHFEEDRAQWMEKDLPRFGNLRLLLREGCDRAWVEELLYEMKKRAPCVKVQREWRSAVLPFPSLPVARTTMDREKEEEENGTREKKKEETFSSWDHESMIRSYVTAHHKTWNKNSNSSISLDIVDEEREWIIREIQTEFERYRREGDGSSSRSSSSLHWEWESLEFQSMFGYGDSVNRIDLRQLIPFSVTGIFGKNSHGKSSIIDILTFMLFGKLTRGTGGNTIPKELIHEGERESRGELIFRVGSRRYKIKKRCLRKMQKQEEKIQIEEKLFEEDNEKEGETSLSQRRCWREVTQEHRKKTDKWIESMIGSFESFLFTHLYLQQHEKSFRHVPPKEKKEFLYHLLGLTWFDAYKTKVEEEVRAAKHSEKWFLEK